MDFDTIRSRINNQTIKSSVELFRDLLLLTNNALVFYSKSTREYKSAILLRDTVTKKIKESLKGTSNKVTTQVTNVPIKLPMQHNPHVKPRSIRPGNRKSVAKATSGNNLVSGVSHETKKPDKLDSPSSVESLSVKKKGFGRPKRIGRGTANQKPTIPTKEKKRKFSMKVNKSEKANAFRDNIYLFCCMFEILAAHIKKSQVALQLFSSFDGFIAFRCSGSGREDPGAKRWGKIFNFVGIQSWFGRQVYPSTSGKLKGLPQGIIHANSDLELRPLWSRSSSRSKANVYSNRSLLAVPVGIKQKQNVDAMVQKFLRENFTIILFHYDGTVDGWWNLGWSSKAIHIVAQNQTKWWFAKRFLHPDIVSIYDYIFLWDEDLGVEHFSPSRYVEIIKQEGLEISQPALDPNSTEIHHRITIRARTKKFHRRVYERRGSTRCSDSSEGPPCTGFVEGMAPVFSRAAWYCTWHLIQNDLVHGWGVDMKLGYCAQGDRTKNVGVVDSEYVFHKGIQTLGGSGHRTTKVSNLQRRTTRQSGTGIDVRTEIRRQSTWEFEIFKERWNEAISQDKNWVDPFKSDQRRIRKRRDTHRISKHSTI
ncbi:unnamed protein product [Sphenostylis stenocarpa]|uniref:Bromo domain-containing protein n=1 Tax=Sphenostylis stenocarpa TaxID=92480 RepID=A0AA86SR06_9FABA|nr:unnamed protein product [Sphenostylis stenocarpa]